MKFTLDALKQYLDTTSSVTDICDALTHIGHEVESVLEPHALDNIVVAHVTDVQKHPDADRLNVCTVDDGSGTMRTIVCGATNVEKGMYGLLAREGAIIPLTGEALKKGKIRGIASEGMLCSEQELCLPFDPNTKTIIKLSEPHAPGTLARNILPSSPTVFDVSITPNRGDCMSVKGLARDLAAYGVGQFHNNQHDASINWNQHISVQNHVPCFYTLCELQLNNVQANAGVTSFLEAVGSKTIHPLVDLTNYASLVMGQPMHVFDADKLQGELVIRMAHDGEKFEALDDNTYTLTNDMIVIADDQGIQALPGVMGGKHSAVSDATKRVYLEAAWFEPQTIAKTGQKLRLFTDARARFERGADPENVVPTVQWALSVLGGVVKLVGATKVGEALHTQQHIKWDASNLEKRLGTNVPNATGILEKLGCAVQGDVVTTPSWRYDLNIADDLIEEVARIHGYHNIPAVSLPPIPLNQKEAHTYELIQQTLLARGLNEVMTWSMIHEKEAELFEGGIKLQEPLTEDMAVMRSSLFPGLLAAAYKNQARHNLPVALYEMAHVYQPKEQNMLAGLRLHKLANQHWQQPKTQTDFYDVKADVWHVCEVLRIDASQFDIERLAPNWYHPYQSCTLKKGPRVVGYIGALAPHIKDFYGLKQNVFGFEIFLDVLSDFRKASAGKMPSIYQEVMRDFSFTIPADKPIDAMIQEMKKLAYVKAAQVSDVYVSADVGRSVSFQVMLQSDTETLSDEQINQTSTSIINLMQEKWGVELRG